MCAFYPFCQEHGCVSDPESCPWNYGPKREKEDASKVPDQAPVDGNVPEPVRPEVAANLRYRPFRL